MSQKNQWLGKYRAYVTDVNDPEERGRIRVKCPKVLGEYKSAWCEVCVPVAYESGGDFYIPKVGEAVWVEFENGEADKPIWVGGWWSSKHTPISNYSNAPNTRVIEYKGCIITMTDGNLKIFKDDGVEVESDSDITLKVGSNKIVVDSTGVHITGNLTITGDVTASNKSFLNHRHTDSEGGTTSTPN